MAGKAASGHNHDSRYYTESEIDSKLGGKANNSNMVGATASAAGKAGLVPAPAKGAATRYLRSDGTWQVPPDNNTTYSVMTGATASAAGKAGLVPAPAKGAQERYLRGDGTWQPIDGRSSTSLRSGGITYGIYRCGRIVEFKVISGVLTSALTAYQKYTIGTIEEGFRPYTQIVKVIYVFGGVGANLNITTDGVVELTPHAALAVGYTPLIHEVYVAQA